jgi:hypothetical protein
MSFLNERKTKLLHLDRNLKQIIKTLKSKEKETPRHQRPTMVNDAKTHHTSVCAFAFSQSLPVRSRSVMP